MEQKQVIDADELRAEVQDAISRYVLRTSSFPPQIEVGPLKVREGPFPSLVTTYVGELFLSFRRGEVHPAGDELEGALARVQEGFQRREIMDGRLRAATCRVDRQLPVPRFYEDDGATLTLAGWLRLDVRS